MRVEIRYIEYGRYMILINGKSLSYSCPTFESALKEAIDCFNQV